MNWSAMRYPPCHSDEHQVISAAHHHIKHTVSGLLQQRSHSVRHHRLPLFLSCHRLPQPVGLPADLEHKPDFGAPLLSHDAGAHHPASDRVPCIPVADGNDEQIYQLAQFP